MRKDGPVCVAVMGTGSAGMRHLRALTKIPGVRPIAVPRREERSQKMEKAGFAVARDIRVAAEMGAKFCIVATDTGRHVEDSIAAMGCGLDVLVEKPLAPDARQGSLPNEKAKETGRKLFVGCVMRFSESLGQFLSLLDRLGPLHSVRIECQSYLPDWRPARHYQESYSARAGEGGVLRDLIHEIDYAGWIFGWPTAIQARVGNRGRLGIEADEAADLWWEMANDCVVSVRLDYLSRPSRRRMRVAGESGTIEWDGIEGTVTLALAEGPVQVLRSCQSLDEMFLEQARAFIEATRGMDDPRLATCEDGVKALAVCDAARRASENRREEQVKYG